jgi:hypothetical protein
MIPFLKVKKVQKEKSTVELDTKAGEYFSKNSSDYEIDQHSLSGKKCLIINETIQGRDNAFSGRITIVTSNVGNSLILEEIGSLSNGDYILIQPNAKEFCYLGSCYFEFSESLGCELRNISDDGNTYMGYMSGLNCEGLIGEIPKPAEISLSGNISPLSNSVKLSTYTLTTSVEKGSFAEYFGPDTHHLYEQTHYHTFNSGVKMSFTSMIHVNFSFFQKIFIKTNLGDLTKNRSDFRLMVIGWSE